VLILERRTISIQYSYLVNRILAGFGNLYSQRERFFLDNGAVNVELYFCHSPKFDEADLTAAFVIFNLSITQDQGRVTHIERHPLKIANSILETIYKLPDNMAEFASNLAKRRAEEESRMRALQELADLVRSVKTKARYDFEFRLITTDEERAELLAANNYEELRPRCLDLLNRYSEYLKNQPILRDLQNVIDSVPQHLNNCQAATRAIEAFNQTFREVQKFFEHARVAAVVTIDQVHTVKMQLEKAIDTLKFWAADFEIEPEPETKKDDELSKIFEEMGIDPNLTPAPPPTGDFDDFEEL
jgi:hypothetical protein